MNRCYRRGEEAQDRLADRADLVPTTTGGSARSSALSESLADRAVRSLVDMGNLRLGHQHDPFLYKVRSHPLHGEVSADIKE